MKYLMWISILASVLTGMVIRPLQANSTAPGALQLSATIESIGVVSAYTGDDNQNSTTALVYRPEGATTWLSGHELYADRAGRQWRGSLVALSPDTTYEIEVRFYDPDGTSPSIQTSSIHTRPDYPEIGDGGTIHYVPDEGGLQTVINSAAAGDTIRMRTGTYYISVVLSEASSGTPGAYLTIEPSPGAKVILDGTDPTINNIYTNNWQLYQGNIYYTTLTWGSQACYDSGTLPNYVGELRDGDGVRYLFFKGSAEWDAFIAAPAGKAYYSCDSTHTLGRLYVVTYAGDDPDNHTIHASRYNTAILFAGADYIRLRHLEFRYYSEYSIHLRKPVGEPEEPGADNNIIEGNTFHGSEYGVFIGQWGNPASANNLIQDNYFYERGYKDSRWDWDTTYHYAWSGGIAVIWAKSGNVIRRNHFNRGSDAIDVNFQSHNTDIYNNLIEDCMDDGIEVDNEPGYNIRVWGNVIGYCLDGVSAQDWFMGDHLNAGPIYVFRNLIVGGRDPYGRRDIAGDIYSSEYAFKVGADLSGGGAGRIYYYHNTIHIPDAVQNGNGIQNAGGAYFSGIVSRNNLWIVTRQVIQLTLPSAIVGHDLDYDNLHNPGTTTDNNFIRWSNTGGPLGNGVYPDLSSFRTYTAQELHGISANNTRLNANFTLQAGSPEIDTGCVIPGFNDRGIWQFSSEKPDIGAYEYSPITYLNTYLPIIIH